MDLLVPLISLVLIAGGGGRQHASFADAATTMATNTKTLTAAQWEAVLPGIPMPPAISALLAQQNGETLGSNKVVALSEPEQKGGLNLNKVTASYGPEQEVNSNKVTASYGPEQENDSNKVTASYGPEQEDNSNKVTASYGSEREDDSNKVTTAYTSEQENDSNKVTTSYGPEQEDDSNKVTASYVPEQEDESNKVTASYGPEQDDDSNKVTASYGPEHEEHSKMQHEDHSEMRHETHVDATREGSHHVHVHNHKNKRKANVLFFRDMLRLGSIITPTISPTTSLPALLPRHIASSIPFSTGRMSDIVAMFAPASLSMTRDIRWTLNMCEKPRTVPGEKSGCATSLESLAELPLSLLGTGNVHAFSATNLPIEAPGTRALRGRYNVTTLQNLSGESSEIVTCHDLTYPYAVYYCHTASPTAAYLVTLKSMDGKAPEVMEALAVCHLDTSQWSPKFPFFAVHNVKPRDVAVCHFLTKLSIVWVRTGEQGDKQAATTQSRSV